MTERVAVAVFPVASVATALKVCGPFVTPAVFQEKLYVGPAPVRTAPKLGPVQLKLHARYACARRGIRRHCDDAAVDIGTVSWRCYRN